MSSVHLRKLLSRMRAFNKFWLPSLVLLIVIAVPCSSQDTSNNLEGTALRLLVGLDRDSHKYGNARTSIVRWYCENGKYQEAADQTATLDLNDRIGMLSYVARTAIDRKDQVSATKVLNTAWSVVAAEKDDDVDGIFTEYFAEVAALNQNLDLATRFATRLDAGSLRKAKVLLVLARSYLDLQNHKEALFQVESALKQIDGFDNEERRDESQIKISAAGVFANAGQVGRANELAAEVQAALLSDGEASTQDKTALGNLFADLGDLPRAMGIVETIKGDERSGALMSLSQHCKVDTIERSLLDRAREEVLKNSSEEYESSLSISSLVTAFLQAGRVDDAFELLQRIRYPYHLHRAAIAVANVLAEQRKIDEAEAALNIASKVARQIVSEKSKDIPSYASSSNAQTKSHALNALIDAYIKLGRLGGAEFAAAAIDHPQYRAIAMSKIGVAYSKNGERSKAHSILLKAQSISDTSKDYSHDSPRESGLLSVVSALAEAGFASDANNALARLLTLVVDDESGDQFAGELFVLARLFESRGISSTSEVDALLKRLLAQQNGDN